MHDKAKPIYLMKLYFYQAEYIHPSLKGLEPCGDKLLIDRVVAIPPYISSYLRLSTCLSVFLLKLKVAMP